MDRTIPTNLRDRTVPSRVEQAVRDIAGRYDLDPHTYLIRCPDKHFKLALESRPDKRNRTRLVGLVHAALLEDEYVDPSDSRSGTYRVGFDDYLGHLVGLTRDEGGYAIFHEVAESPFYQHIIENGTHLRSHRVVCLVPSGRSSS